MSLPGDRLEMRIALPYFAIYVAYLFWHPESELLHWATMVAVPLLIVLMLQEKGPRSIARAFASFGLSKDNLRRGITGAVGLSILVCVVQLLLSQHSEEIWALLRSVRALYLLPLVFLFLMLTAGSLRSSSFAVFCKPGWNGNRGRSG